MRAAQIIIICIACYSLVVGGIFGGYIHSKKINSAVCYPCLGLEQKFITIEFVNFSTKEVAHPQWVKDKLKDEAVFIFIWATSCESCERQWEDMKSAGIVEGEESNGKTSANYTNNVELYSLDYDTDHRATEVIQAYHPSPQSAGLPFTVIITLVKENNAVKLGWYAFVGFVESSSLKKIIESAIYYHSQNSAQWKDG
jgi:thiol-disulfide isomerase/thioredoxin